MNLVYLISGGNIGDKLMNLKEACFLIEREIGPLQKKSMIYETEPWGFEAVNTFFNQAVLVLTEDDPGEVFVKIKKIESHFGRDQHKTSKYESRTIDIDILFFNDVIVNLPDINLFIPHMKIHLRNFVLIPMNEIAPGHIHPVFNKTINQLLNECKDDKWVKSILIS